MSSHVYKRVQPKPEPWRPKQWRGYSPVALVKEFGDRWMMETQNEMPDVSAATVIAIRGRTQDSHDYFLMCMMEKGVMPRIRVDTRSDAEDDQVLGRKP